MRPRIIIVGFRLLRADAAATRVDGGRHGIRHGERICIALGAFAQTSVTQPPARLLGDRGETGRPDMVKEPAVRQSIRPTPSPARMSRGIAS